MFLESKENRTVMEHKCQLQKGSFFTETNIVQKLSRPRRGGLEKKPIVEVAKLEKSKVKPSLITVLAPQF